MLAIRSRSVLAIDPTTRGVAFAFFENGKLLDWGARLALRDVEDGVRIVDRLIEACAVDVLVIEDPDAAGCLRRARIRELLRTLMKRKRRSKIAVVTVPKTEVRDAWEAEGLRNKESVAMAIGTRLPELADMVPPRRKPGRNEDPRVNVFDAVSLALHVFGSTGVGP